MHSSIPEIAFTPEVYRWLLWRKGFAFEILPSRASLDASLAELEGLGARFFDDHARPVLEPAFPALCSPSGDADIQKMRWSIHRIGGASFQLAEQLCAVHGGEAGRAGPVAAWMGIAGSVIDQLIDEQATDPHMLASHLDRERMAKALPVAGAPVGFADRRAPEGLQFLLAILDQAFAGARGLFAGAPSANRLRVREEMLACLARMAEAELRSPMLRFELPLDLAVIEHQLEEVNTLAVWVSAYLGLFTHPADARAIETLLRVTQRVARIGWLLDAVADAYVDLQAGVWSLVWIRVARRYGTNSMTDRAGALRALVASTVIDEILGELEVLIAQVEEDEAVPTAVRGPLALLCRTSAWSFLAPRCDEPDSMRSHG